MFIVYANNSFILANQAELRKRFDGNGPVVFRNAPSYQGEVEACDGVAVFGDFPNIVNAYDNAEVKVDTYDELQPTETKKAPKKAAKPKAEPVGETPTATDHDAPGAA